MPQMSATTSRCESTLDAYSYPPSPGVLAESSDAGADALAEAEADPDAETDSEVSPISRTEAPSSVPLHDAATRAATARNAVAGGREAKRCMAAPFGGLSSYSRGA